MSRLVPGCESCESYGFQGFDCFLSLFFIIFIVNLVSLGPFLCVMNKSSLFLVPVLVFFFLVCIRETLKTSP